MNVVKSMYLWYFHHQGQMTIRFRPFLKILRKFFKDLPGNHDKPLVLVLKGNGKLLEKTGGKQPVRYGGNILILLLVDNVIIFLLQVRDINFHEAFAVGSGVNNHLGRALLNRGNQVLAVIDVFLAGDLGEIHDGCVEGHACFEALGFGGFDC